MSRDRLILKIVSTSKGIGFGLLWKMHELPLVDTWVLPCQSLRPKYREFSCVNNFRSLQGLQYAGRMLVSVSDSIAGSNLPRVLFGGDKIEGGGGSGRVG
mmetsp:Transcript_13419/g.24650  ORF Transcript_13419/g.24650 Transcript_13419/m.24650 type:complete len:100 (+) Transcript_13419:695-994(+)